MKAEIQGESGPATVLITTPVNPDDMNVRYRLTRSDLVRRELVKTKGAESVRFPKVLATKMQTDQYNPKFVASFMEEWIPTEPVSYSVHLAKPGAFTQKDMEDVANLFSLEQTVMQPYTKGEEAKKGYHSHISDKFSDRAKNKWWIDITNKDRLEAYSRVFGDTFVKDLQALMNSDETAQLFPSDAPLYYVFGNFISFKLGRDASDKLVVRDTERTCVTQYRAFDYASFLETLVSDPARMEEFFQFAITQNNDKHFFEHLRRSVLLDRLGNLVDLVRDRGEAEKAGDTPQRDFLDFAINNFKHLANEALHQTGMWDPKKLGLA